MLRRSLPFWFLLIWVAVIPLPLPALTNGVALIPPMGWNSWNNFGCNINEGLIRAMADAMATNGMKAAGYQFINMDDCWQGTRDPTGVIVPDPARFPSGIKALADYVHSKGLKLGLYSDHGLQTCGGRPGGYGYEYLDANTYASWGVDYLKYDNCNLPSGDVPQTDYLHMSDALMRSGRPITFSICAWTFDSWDPDLGNLWRTTGDISDSFSSMVSKLAPNSASAYVAGTGRWNDPDMLEVGRGGMTTAEDQSHFTLWCMMGAPLIAGNDLTSMSAQTLAILSNPEVIAVDQDPAAEQGIQVAGSATNQIWCKPLGFDFSTKAVALFNINSNLASITCYWTNLGLQAGSAAVRDLWARTDLGTFTDSFTTNVPAHGVVMLKVAGTAPSLPGLGTNYLSDLQSAYAYVGWGAITQDRSIGGNTLTLNGTNYSKGLGVHALSGVEYRLGAIASRFMADIGVDDEVGAGLGSVVFQVYGDGLKIYDSGVLHEGAPHQTVNLDVTGVNRLTLGVHDADDGINYDHADWAGARITVLSTVPAPPPAPTGLAANPGNPILLTWNTTRSATNYNVKRAMAAPGPYTTIATVPLPGYSDNSVISGTTYSYKVSALDGFGESANSSVVSLMACSTPGAPAGLTAGATGSQIMLAWNPAPGATSYNVARSTSATPFAPIATALTGTSFTDTNVVQGVTYFYIVAGSNSCNQGAFSSPVSGTTAPLAPTGLMAVPGGSEAVLTWRATSPASGFNVRRSTTNGGPYLLVANNVASPPWLDNSLGSGTTYYYVVSAINAGGESPNSTQASVTPCGGGLPSGWADQDIGTVGFAGSASSCASSFILQGSGVDIWGTADAFNFASTSLTGDGAIVARVVAVQNTDSWAKAGVMFRNDTTAVSMFADVFVSPGNGVNFQWRTTPGGQCGSTGLGGLVAPIWVKLARAGTNFTASYGSDGIHWTSLGSSGIAISSVARAGLEVTAHNNSALCLAAFDHVATGAPAAPTGLTAFGGNGWVTLNWNPSAAAASYNVKRSNLSGGPYGLLGSLTGTSTLDTAVVNWSTWYYVVSAVNALGESANSSEVVATPRPPPSLNAAPNGGQLQLSWPNWATGYNAYSASNLVSPVQWQLVTNVPQSGGGMFNLLLPTTAERQFFELKGP
jgi:alpha-galactosidase